MNRVIVVVSGGVVQGIYSDVNEVQAEVLDYDNKDGETNPEALAHFEGLERQLEEWKSVGNPNAQDLLNKLPAERMTLVGLLKGELANQCQSIQDDLDCVLDGIDQDFMDRSCQVVVDRFKILKELVDRFQ